MKYSEVRHKIENGDQFLVQGWGPVSIFIRVFSAHSYSHVAMLVWHDDGLFTHEMRGLTGYTITPASQWLYRIKGNVEFGKAPATVSGKPDKIKEFVREYRATRYGWLSLGAVWLSQVTKMKWPTFRDVCSTFSQAGWAFCGWAMKGNASPGNIATNCRYKIPIDRWEIKVLTSPSKMIKKLD